MRAWEEHTLRDHFSERRAPPSKKKKKKRQAGDSIVVHSHGGYFSLIHRRPSDVVVVVVVVAYSLLDARFVCICGACLSAWLIPFYSILDPCHAFISEQGLRI